MMYGKIIFALILTVSILILPTSAVGEINEFTIYISGNSITMMSLPLKLDGSLKDNLIINGCKIDLVSWYDPLGEVKWVDSWISPANNLEQIKSVLTQLGKGFFIRNIGPPCSVTFKGQLVKFSTTLSKGWNLISGLSKFSSSCTLHDETYSDYTKDGKYTALSLPDLINRGLSPGKAYWVYVNSDNCKISDYSKASKSTRIYSNPIGCGKGCDEEPRMPPEIDVVTYCSKPLIVPSSELTDDYKTYPNVEKHSGKKDNRYFVYISKDNVEPKVIKIKNLNDIKVEQLSENTVSLANNELTLSGDADFVIHGNPTRKNPILDLCGLWCDENPLELTTKSKKVKLLPIDDCGLLLPEKIYLTENEYLANLIAKSSALSFVVAKEVTSQIATRYSEIATGEKLTAVVPEISNIIYIKPGYDAETLLQYGITDYRKSLLELPYSTGSFSHNSIIAVDIQNKIVVGHASLADLDFNIIKTIGVREEYRNLGVGRRLFEIAIEIADTSKPVVITSKVEELTQNVGLRKLLDEMGFVPTAEDATLTETNYVRPVTSYDRTQNRIVSPDELKKTGKFEEFTDTLLKSPEVKWSDTPESLRQQVESSSDLSQVSYIVKRQYEALVKLGVIEQSTAFKESLLAKKEFYIELLESFIEDREKLKREYGGYFTTSISRRDGIISDLLPDDALSFQDLAVKIHEGELEKARQILSKIKSTVKLESQQIELLRVTDAQDFLSKNNDLQKETFSQATEHGIDTESVIKSPDVEVARRELNDIATGAGSKGSGIELESLRTAENSPLKNKVISVPDAETIVGIGKFSGRLFDVGSQLVITSPFLEDYGRDIDNANLVLASKALNVAGVATLPVSAGLTIASITMAGLSGGIPAIYDVIGGMATRFGAVYGISYVLSVTGTTLYCISNAESPMCGCRPSDDYNGNLLLELEKYTVKKGETIKYRILGFENCPTPLGMSTFSGLINAGSISNPIALYKRSLNPITAPTGYELISGSCKFQQNGRWCLGEFRVDLGVGDYDLLMGYVSNGESVYFYANQKITVTN